jgi:hypothetical protein
MSSPTITQQRTIDVLCEVLGIERIVPASDIDARYVIDDLRWREKRMKRA